MAASFYSSRPNLRTLRCRQSVEVCMDFLSFDIGRLVIPEETSLFSLLSQCFSKIADIFNLNDPYGILTAPSTLERILGSIFDTSSLPLVTDKSVRILAGLDDHDKSCLYVQAAAGIVLFFRRLSLTAPFVSAGVLSRELQLFAESEQRPAFLEKIEATSLFSSCYTKSCIVDFVMAAIEERKAEHHDSLSPSTAGRDLLSDSVTWANDRPCKNMGLPWGFAIMALN